MAERWLVGKRTKVAACSTLALIAALLQMTPAVALTQSQTFEYTGGDQTFTVPAGVTSLHVTLVGARGGNGFASFSSFGVGGFGATVTADLAVTPGTTIHVEVGGAGGNGTTTAGAASFNGGGASGADSVPAGGGGGATDLRLPDATIGSRVLVAGGGGGGGGYYGGGGGSAGASAGDGGSGIGLNVERPWPMMERTIGYSLLRDGRSRKSPFGDQGAARR